MPQHSPLINTETNAARIERHPRISTILWPWRPVLADDGNVADEALLIAAILHDTVEDTSTSFTELVEHFGHDVSNLVAEVTDDKSLPKERRKELQIETAAGKSDRAKQLKNF